MDIANQIKSDYAIEIDKHRIHLVKEKEDDSKNGSSSIKRFGSYKFRIRIFGDVEAEILVMVSEN